MKFTTHTLGFRVQEVPIIFTDRTLGTSKMNKGIIKEAVFGVITMKIRAIFGKIKIFSVLLTQPFKALRDFLRIGEISD